jgi:flagellar biosynthetic protein FliR
MPNEPLTSYVVGFSLVAARVGGAFIFVPIPGLEQTSLPPKILLILAITFSLFSLWPVVDVGQGVIGLIVTGIAKEVCVGICLGLVVALTSEFVNFGFHLVGIQAGYSFATTIDPTSQADVTVLEALGRLLSGLLFFSLGLHHEVIRAFAASLQAHPAGMWTVGPSVIEPVIRLFQVMLATGLRLALPLIASMVMIDIALGLIGRISSQVHLLHMSFPIKMLASLLLISWIITALPSIFKDLAARVLHDMHAAIGI